MTVSKQYNLRPTFTITWAPTAVPNLLAYHVLVQDAEGQSRTWEHLSHELPTIHNWTPQAPNWMLLSLEGLAEFAQWGWDGEEGAFLWRQGVSRTPWSDRASSQYRLVRLDPLNNMLFDEQGEPLVVAQSVMEFPDGGLLLSGVQLFNREEMSRLDLAALRAHPHVSDWTYGQALSFRWTPDLETYRRAWAKCRELNPQNPGIEFCRAIRVLGLLDSKQEQEEEEDNDEATQKAESAYAEMCLAREAEGDG